MDDTDYAFEDQTYAVIGAALEVLSQLGHGINEKPYENALAIELRNRGSRGFGRNLAETSVGPRLGTHPTYLRKSAVIVFLFLCYAAFSSLLFRFLDSTCDASSFLTIGATRVPRSSIACIAFRWGITPPFSRMVILLIPPSTSFS
jgi:hypothetical protein